MRGCERISTARRSSRAKSRPEVDAAFASLHEVDTLAVWRFDCLARSLLHLTALADELERW